MLKTLCVVLLTLSQVVQAQHNVTFIVETPAIDKPIFIAGSFNSWSPGTANYKLTNNRITLNLPTGIITYKFTKGSWGSEEAGANGDAIANRQVTVSRDTTITIRISYWADQFMKKKVTSTASKNVHIIDTAFYIPQLKRYRRVWIYLPESYTTGRKKYPVLYMQDGQNVFDAATSFSGEWGVDEALDTLAPGIRESIVVAIDNGGEKRMNEYAPYNMERFGKGEGDQYVDFLVKTLKPYIKKNYRVRKCSKHHFVAGSSMGGLISLYALLKYPKEFGGAGVFSPSFWIAPDLKRDIEKRGKKVRGKIYFMAGMKESEDMVPDMLAVFEALHKQSKAQMTTVIRTEGQHNEATWRNEFPLFYNWLMSR